MENQQKDTAWKYIRPWLRRVKYYVEAVCQPWFRLKGNSPHDFGYNWHKENQIKKIINSTDFQRLGSTVGYGLKIDERIVEYPWFLSRIPSTSGRLLDAGSALNHRFLLDHSKLQNKNIFISTLAPESDSWWRKGISYVFEDFRFSCFRDEYFDWIACISTLEHVGLDNTLLYTGDATKKENSGNDVSIVMRELKRMLRSNGKLYLTFPYGKHQNFGWFQIMDANMVETLSQAFEPSQRIDRYFKYTVEGWQDSTPEELVDADYFDPHTANASKALDGAAGARGLVCLEWTA